MIKAVKKIVYERQAEIISAIAQPTRLAILDFLRNGARCVCEIAKQVKSERTNVSKHLSVLCDAGILEREKIGSKVFYRLTSPCVLDFSQCVINLIQERSQRGSSQQISSNTNSYAKDNQKSTYKS